MAQQRLEGGRKSHVSSAREQFDGTSRPVVALEVTGLRPQQGVPGATTVVSSDAAGADRPPSDAPLALSSSFSRNSEPIGRRGIGVFGLVADAAGHPTAARVDGGDRVARSPEHADPTGTARVFYMLS